MKKFSKGLTLSVAAGALLMVGASAQAQGMAQSSATMTATTAAPTQTPVAVTGRVLRYYVNRAGYVTAMDVQTADGVRMVRFMPSMAQRLTTTYPVGTDNVTVYVVGTPMGSRTRYDLVSVGPNMPAPSSMMMTTQSVSDVDWLRAEPYILAGAQGKRMSGELTGYVADPKSGEVLALVLDNRTLVRVPQENRLMAASSAPEGVTPLLKNSIVDYYGYPEAPRYGIISPYSERYVATGLSVNGRTVGPFGFGTVATSPRKGLLGFNLNLPGIIGGSAPETVEASNMGYYEYQVPATTVQ
jgi:hypothetical protein